MLLPFARRHGAPVVHHVGRVGRWSGDAPGADPIDMAWRLAAVVLNAEGAGRDSPGRAVGGDVGERVPPAVGRPGQIPR